MFQSVSAFVVQIKDMLFCLQVFDGEECPHLVLLSQDPAERNQGGEVEEGEKKAG